MLASAGALMRERGASATSVDDVLRHSGAPRGSVYHHFPGGRAQLVEEAVLGERGTVDLLLAAMGDVTPVTALDAFLAVWRARLAESDFRAGCPVLAVAIERDDDEPQLAEASRAVFAEWRDGLAGLLARNAVPRARARSLATLVVAAIEGAVALSRVERDLRPLDDVGRELRAVLAAATP
jgi:AcrR family transcriptional regulator